ncbi:hypothetical protein NA57DRAFT_33789 [Rhizodiscina lignyota]|uniref:3-hydroxyacyl-CoA dehydrogenase n=1 Tax=Rhizodiscina lignyota TaxID=1504668 RepID=A0A9P4IPK5_9PEZI|nr:hypothetical protein NA57DRAFT_33789 [Rhizodiscina lignyota]
MSSSIIKLASSPRITLVGAGTIGLSFAGFHLRHLRAPEDLTILDTRPDLREYVKTNLPKYLDASQHHLVSRVNISDSLQDAVKDADIVEEQGPENLPFKESIWPKIEEAAPKHALLWSSTSGIPASQQSAKMQDKTRLLVVHPYNPPHIIPLLEVVPSPSTSKDVISQTLTFWKARGREPIVMKKECIGFVSNRLAFALLREGIHLVKEGVLTVEEVDRLVETSMGPRWAVWGPFKSYHAGGGPGGLEGFFKNIGGTVQGCWDDAGRENVGDGWERDIFCQAQESYGVVDTAQRDEKTRKILEITRK